MWSSQVLSRAHTGASDAEIALVGTYQGVYGCFSCIYALHRNCDSLFHPTSGALDAYARRPDCFKDSAALISARCEELDSREDERVRGE